VYKIEAAAHAPLVRSISHRRGAGLGFVTYYLLCRCCTEETKAPRLASTMLLHPTETNPVGV